MFWSAVTFAIGNNTTTITKVTDVQIDYGVTLKGFQGDNDRYMTTKVATLNEPKATVSSGNIGILNGLAGASGTFSATHNDVKAASGGAIVYTLINALAGSVTASGAVGEYGQGSLPIESFSSDGSTSPLSFTRS
jgi:hypothetical protein